MTFQPSDGFAPFLPTSIYLPDDYSQMLLRLQAFLTEISLKVNAREIGLFEQTELLTGQTWFPETGELISQQTFRQVYIVPAIAAGANTTIPINITSTNGVTYTHIYGTVKTDAPDDRPIPYAASAVVTNGIAVAVINGNIQIFVGATSPNVLSGIVVLEYLKN